MVDKDAPLERWAPRRVPLDCGTLKGRQFDITYESGSGDLSGRRVRAESLSHVDGTLYLEAFCYLRDEARTFALERICQVVDCATGEVFRGAIAWLESCGLWFRDGEPQVRSLGSDGHGTHNFELRINMPLPSAGDRPAREDQRAALHDAFVMPPEHELGERQAAALLAWWDYAGALVRLMPAHEGTSMSGRELQTLIAVVISTLPKASADIALWSVRRWHQPINPQSLPKMSHFEEIGEGVKLALQEMDRRMSRRSI